MPKSYAVVRQRGYVKRGGHHRLDVAFDQCARLYNLALERWQMAYERDGKDSQCTLYDDFRAFTALRAADPFWHGCSQEIGRGTLERLQHAKQGFYRRCKQDGVKAGYPKFKAARRWRTIEVRNPTPGMVTSKRGKWVVKVKGLPILVLRPRRKLPPSAQLKRITITRKASGLWVSLSYQVSHVLLQPAGKMVGIDVGVTARLALSDGSQYPPRQMVDTKPLERRISRCQRGSNNQRKLYRQLARQKQKEAERNRQACHRLTTDLIRGHDLIAIEDLAIANMTRSARGTVEKPGRRVAQKRGLNRSIQQQTWGILRWQLAYKGQWYGRLVVAVDPRHTSQTCAVCGTIEASARQGKRYECQACGHAADADVNAARVILQRGVTMAGDTIPVGSPELPEHQHEGKTPAHT